MLRFDLWTSLPSIAEQCGVPPFHGHWLDRAVGNQECSDPLGFTHSYTFLGAPLPFHLLQVLPRVEKGRRCCGFCVWRKHCCLWQHQPKAVQRVLVDPLKIQWRGLGERWLWWGWHEVAQEWITGSNGREKVKLNNYIILPQTSRLSYSFHSCDRDQDLPDLGEVGMRLLKSGSTDPMAETEPKWNLSIILLS